MLMEQMGNHYVMIERKFSDMENLIDEKIEASEERTKRHFDVVAEDLRHDYMGIYKDSVEHLKNRVTRLEEHTGLRR